MELNELEVRKEEEEEETLSLKSEVVMEYVEGGVSEEQATKTVGRVMASCEKIEKVEMKRLNRIQ